MRTDRHDEANSHFSQFCKSAKKRQQILKARNADTGVGIYKNVTVQCFNALSHHLAVKTEKGPPKISASIANLPNKSLQIYRYI